MVPGFYQTTAVTRRDSQPGWSIQSCLHQAVTAPCSINFSAARRITQKRTRRLTLARTRSVGNLRPEGMR